MAAKVYFDQNQLINLLNDEETVDQALDTYFEPVDVSAEPFSANFQLRPKANVVLKSETAQPVVSPFSLVMSIANKIARRRRETLYRKHKEIYPTRDRLVSEGDSWFQHPLIADTIDHLFNWYNVCDLAAAGDELSSMYRLNEISKSIDSEKPIALLLSGGGNDILGKGFKTFLKDFTPGANASSLINQNFDSRLQQLHSIYSTLFTNLGKSYPTLPVLIHGYDYVVPRAGSKGKWLGKHLRKHGIVNEALQREVLREMIDRFNGTLRELDTAFDNLHYVDVRGSVLPDQWKDEIHPDSVGFQQVAIKIQNKLNTLKHAATQLHHVQV